MKSTHSPTFSRTLSPTLPKKRSIKRLLPLTSENLKPLNEAYIKEQNKENNWSDAADVSDEDVAVLGIKKKSIDNGE